MLTKEVARRVSGHDEVRWLVQRPRDVRLEDLDGVGTQPTKPGALAGDEKRVQPSYPQAP